MLVLEPFRYLFMFPLSYKHPQGQADVHCVFMRPHSHSSTCDGKVAGGEEPSHAELDWSRSQRVGGGWLSGDGDVVLFEGHWVLVCVVCVQFCAWCLSLFGISFPVFAGEIDALYPSRPCSSATRSLKLFLFSFPGGINSPIFSAPQSFFPILLQHRLCLPGCLSVSLPDCDLFEQMVCIWHISDFS